MHRKYITAFIITVAIFGLAFLFSNYISNKKLKNVRSLYENINVDVLSNETMFTLMEKASCKSIAENLGDKYGFNSELASLVKRVKFMESQLGSNDQDVLSLKKQYTLLQIKDYLLNEDYSARCNLKTVTLLYFHDTECSECAAQSAVLDRVLREYPETRVYWFDISVSSPVVDMLARQFRIKESPSIVINDTAYSGLQDFNTVSEILDKLIPPTDKI